MGTVRDDGGGDGDGDGVDGDDITQEIDQFVGMVRDAITTTMSDDGGGDCGDDGDGDGDGDGRKSTSSWVR